MTPEQQARDMLERMGVDGAQQMTAGDVAELANLIAYRDRMQSLDKAFEQWLQEGEKLFGGDRPQALTGESIGVRLAYAFGVWWGERPRVSAE